MDKQPPNYEDYIKELDTKLRHMRTAENHEIADDIQRILAGKATVHSIFEEREREKQSKWETYKTAERLESKPAVTCKKCGYKRWFHKEYGDPCYQCPNCRGEYAVVNDDHHYTPNSVPRNERISGLAFSLIIAAYVAYGLATGTIYIPGKHGSLELHGWAMVPASLALLSIGGHTLTYILDHYDRRNNEYIYEQIRFWSGVGYIALLVTAGVTQIYFMINP